MNTPTPKNDQPTYAMLAKMRDRARTAENQLTAVTEQRNEYEERYLKLAGKYAIEMHEITEQRDRLAETVNAATILIAAKGRHNTMLAYEGLREALKSLNTQL